MEFSITTSKLKKKAVSLANKVHDRGVAVMGDTYGGGNSILGGIMLMIVGFATLILGNYIVYQIYTSLPALNSADYNTTSASIISYATTVIPLFGLALMVLGFSLILFVLRRSQD